jgi:hypothetical protein
MWYSNLKKKHLFLDVSSSNIATLVPSLYQCVETRNIEVFWLLSQPLPHLRFNLFAISETLATTRLWTALLDKHYAPQTGNISLWISFALSPFTQKKKTHNRTLLFGSTPLKHGRHFDPDSEYAHARLLRLPRSWALLLSSDTHRKSITSITAGLLPFMSYLLTLPRTLWYI